MNNKNCVDCKNHDSKKVLCIHTLHSIRRISIYDIFPNTNHNDKCYEYCKYKLKPK